MVGNPSPDSNSRWIKYRRWKGSRGENKLLLLLLTYQNNVDYFEVCFSDIQSLETAKQSSKLPSKAAKTSYQV